MKKILRWTVITILSIIILFSGYALISGKTFLFKAVWYNFAAIDDYKHFTNNIVTTAEHAPWQLSANYNKTPLPSDLKTFLEGLSTVSLLAIKNDSIVYEEYWDGYSDSSLSGSFSMAKSITSLLVGAALQDGRIKSLDEPVSDFLPEFAEGDKAKVKIIDLLTMSSGSNWDESYANPLSVTTELYYGSDVYKTATGVKMIHTPGTLHDYKSGDSQLLGLIVEKATGKSLSAYAAEKLWKPLEAEHAALWSTDRKGGNEKAYCCFNSNARDFARIGQMMLDGGKWNGKTVIDSTWCAQSIKPCMIPDPEGKPCDYYGYQWWLMPGENGIFYARGILGQYIIVIPSNKTVIVRLGKKRASTIINHAPEEVQKLIDWGTHIN
jgi:CubicO group peptidase (beta-lactamase class C family)